MDHQRRRHGRRQLTQSGDGTDYSPTWSLTASGSHFVPTEPNTTNIFVINAEGTGERDLTTRKAGSLGRPLPFLVSERKWIAWSDTGTAANLARLRTRINTVVQPIGAEGELEDPPPRSSANVARLRRLRRSCAYLSRLPP